MYNNQAFTVEAAELLNWVQSAIDSMGKSFVSQALLEIIPAPDMLYSWGNWGGLIRTAEY